MNLSFSTNKWNDFNILDFFDIASEYKFNGFEIHDISKLKDTDIKSAYHKISEYKILKHIAIFIISVLYNSPVFFKNLIILFF